MLSWLGRRSAERRKAKELYGAVVTQARQPLFYAGLRVPDTPEGRYELIVLHLFLVMERLRALGAPAQPLSRRLVEAFVEDMDDAMREMGVGDLTVPKKVKRAAAGFYERAGQYRTALASASVGALEAALAAHVWPPTVEQPAADLLAEYVVGAARALDEWPTERLLEGAVEFPPVVYFEM